MSDANTRNRTHDAARRITIADTVLHQRVDDETVLLLGGERYYGLDAVGTRVWELLQEHGEIDPIVATLVDEYDAGAAAVRADVERLLGELAGTGLIELEPGTGA